MTHLPSSPANRLLSWFCGLALLVLSANTLHAQQSNNTALHTVPVPKAVVVDGKLDDWDLSGQFEAFANYRTRNTYSVRVAAMYDDQNLYLSIVWRDPTPLQNNVNAEFEVGSGWKSDCVQLRMKTDIPISLDCWYSTTAQKSVININYGSFQGKSPVTQDKMQQNTKPNALDLGAQEAFTVGEDGKSYTQEIALPWKLITGANILFKDTQKPVSARTSYKPGEQFQMGMEFLWGGPDGRTFPIHRYADLVRQAGASREFFWDAENDWGPVILEKTGNLKLPAPDYTILAGAYLQKSEGPIALNYTMPFDGFATLVIENDKGQRVKNLAGMAQRAKGPQTDFWDCTDERGRLVEPGKYRFRGLVHQGIDPVYEATYGTPGSPPWDTGDGSGAWLSDHTSPRTVAAGKDMMVLGSERGESGYSIIGVDPATGRKKWGDRTLAGVSSVVADDQYAYIHLNAWDVSSALARLELKTGRYAPFITAQGSQLRVSVPKPENPDAPPPDPKKPPSKQPYTPNIALGTDRIAIPLDGKVLRFYDKKTAALLLEMPVSGLGVVATNSAGEFFAWTDKTIAKLVAGKFQPVITKDLPEWASGMTIDAEGRFFLSDHKTQQVRVYDKAGKFLNTIGVDGGRQLGKWNPNALKNPMGLAVDPSGSLWVAEEDSSPRRYSLWSADGKFLKDYIGPTGYGGTGANADPDDKTRVFGSGCEWKLDYATNKATVVAVLGEVSGELLKHDGKEYIMNRSGRLYLRVGDKMKFVAAAGSVDVKDYGNVTDIALPVAPGGTHGYANISYVWTDLNDDGISTPDEVVTGSPWTGWKEFKYPIGICGYFGGYWLDEKFNAYGEGRESFGAYGGRGFQITKMPLKGWTKGGAPIWDPSKQILINDKAGWGGCTYLPSNGTFIADLNCFKDNGEFLWSYPDRWYGVHASHNAPIPDRDDTLIGTLGCIGRAQTNVGTVFAMNSNMGRMYLMTTDGLFVASVFQDCRLGSDPWPNSATVGTPLGGVTMGSEWFGGHFFKAEKTNEFYLIAGFTAYNMIKLNGMNTLQALSGNALEVTSKELLASQEMARARLAKTPPVNTKLVLATATPALDGNLTGFEKESFVGFSDGPYKIKAALANDKENLYVAFDVAGDDNPMVNGGKDVQQLFVTGDSVNVNLRTNPAGKVVGDAAIGDIRLLITNFEGKPTAVLYRFKVAQGAAPVKFTCPWRDYTVDKVEVLTDAKIKITKRQNGYILEAAVPLATLGFAPEAGKSYKADLGVIFSDAKGDNRAARVYWHNKGTGLVADVPGEIMPEVASWGTVLKAP